MSWIVTATELSGLVTGAGVAGTGTVKGIQMARRFGHFLDQWFGDGNQSKGVIARLTALEAFAKDSIADRAELKNILSRHVDQEVPKMIAAGAETLEEIRAVDSDHESRIRALEAKVDPVIRHQP